MIWRANRCTEKWQFLKTAGANNLIARYLRRAAGIVSILSIAVPIGVPSLAAAESANNYPDKPIRLVVAYQAGGVADNVGRVLAAGLTEALGQPVYVDNRGGAGGTIGASFVAKSAPDGYTLLISSPPMIAVAPLLMPQRPYDPKRDFTPIGTFATTPNILVSNLSVPAKSLKELVAYVKGPGKGKVTYATGGPGSTGLLSGQILNRSAGINMVAIPYRNSAQGQPDLLSGRVSVLFDSVPSTIGLIRSGRVRPLVVMSEKRSPLLPDVPTIAEEGFPSATMQFWLGLQGPPGMAPVIVEKLNKALRTVMAKPDTVKHMEMLGAQAFLTSPGEFRALQDRDIARYKPLVQEIGLQ